MSKIKIESIWLDNACCDSRGMGITLNVYLNNGAGMMLLLDSKASEPLFRGVMMNECAPPQTDGERVYWENGASLTLQEMLTILQTQRV
jgi:hypothetical protein